MASSNKSNNFESQVVIIEPEQIKANRFPQYMAALSVSMGAMAAGAALAWTGNISAEMEKQNYNGIEIDDDSLGWIGSMPTLGATAACFFIGKLCDMLGRKPAMLLLTIPFVIGWLLVIFADSLLMMYIGRFLTGVAGGAFGVSGPLYTTEIAQKEIRGALGSYFELLLTVGILFAYAVAMIMDIRNYTIVMTLVPIVFAIMFAFQPESPVFLLKNNQDEEGRAALIRLRGEHFDVDSEIREIKFSLKEEENNNISFCESFKKKATQKAALICFSLMFLEKVSGICAVEFYADYIFQSAGSTINPNTATLIIGVIQVVATLGSALIVDRLGRRILLIGSCLAMAISAAALGIFFTLLDRKLADDDTMAILDFLPITAISAFVITFSLGIGTVVWMLSSELFPPEVKSSGAGIATAFNWIGAFLTLKFYMDVKNAFGTDVTYYIFALISLVGTVFIYFIVPETKAKTLEHIQRELSGIKLNVDDEENDGKIENFVY